MKKVWFESKHFVCLNTRELQRCQSCVNDALNFYEMAKCHRRNEMIENDNRQKSMELLKTMD